MIDENLKLTELIDAAILQKIQDAFAKIARLASLTADENGVAVTQPSNFSDLCTKFCRKSPIGRARCEYCDKMGAVMSMERHKPVSYKCHANLVDFAAPIMLGDRMIGSFIGGQVLPEEPDLEKMRQVAREIGVDEDEFVEAAKRTQIIPQEAIDRSTEFIYEFAQIMSAMAYDSYVSKQLSEEAKQAAVQKADFLANMSHEIRTPMNAVLGMAEMALREEMSKEAREYVSQIQSAGKHLLVIINDILDFSKIDSGKMEIVETIYEMEEMLQDISHLINSRIGKKEVDFILDIPYDMPVELIGDNVRIQQTLINLLVNAVKFTTRGKIILRMRYEKISEDEVMIQADVIDTGKGIKKEDIDKLFQSFHQVDSKRNRNIEGTGLGLAISKQLIELMQGTISVESEYGKGSTFTIRYPQKVQTFDQTEIQREEPLNIYILMGNANIKEQILEDLSVLNAKVSDLADSHLEAISGGSFFIVERALMEAELGEVLSRYPEQTFIIIESYDAPNDLQGKNIRILRKPVYSRALFAALGIGELQEHKELAKDRAFSFVAPEAHILIVDDNPVNLSVAKGLLEPLEMQVDTAESVAVCIDMLNSNAYDIIFMDHMMPEVDGIEGTHIIRRMIAGYEEVPIIALTANAVSGIKEMFLREGMNDFVAKPIETKKIVEKVKQWLPKEKLLPVSERKNKSNQKEVREISAIPKIEGVNVDQGLALLGSEKLYMKVLKDFYLAIDRRSELIQTAFEEKNYENYTIEVHSLKSIAKQIGAESLSEFAAQMEKAGNEGNVSFIDANTAALLSDYRKLKEKLSLLFADGAAEAGGKKAADRESIAACLEQLIAALEEIDSLAIEEALENFAQYTYGKEKEKEYLEQIRKASEEFDIDICMELAVKWKEEIYNCL